MQVLKTVIWIVVILLPLTVGGMVLVGGGDGICEGDASIQVRRRVPHVFTWCAEPDRRMQWIDGLVKSSHRSVFGMEAGESFTETHRTETGQEQRRVEVTELVDGQRFAYRTTIEGRPYEVTIEVDAPYQADRTVVFIHYRTEFEGTLAKLAEPVFAAQLHGRVIEDLERLKERAEAAAE